MKRKSGILLHPSSLPGPNGIGEIGSGALPFLDFLRKAGQTVWQILPLGPCGYGNSPYSALSSFAGNPLLISLSDLLAAGYLERMDLPDKCLTLPSTDWIVFSSLNKWKFRVLDKAADTFLSHSPGILEGFRKAHPWLADYSLFMALRDHFNAKAEKEGVLNAQWNSFWPAGIAKRNPDEMKKWEKKLNKEILVHQALQYFFLSQWQATKKAAYERGIRIIGDIPIFVAPDSADVWAERDIFLLDKDMRATSVAGVPPDYFSATGQRWGNPLYDWKRLADTGYDWWLRRIEALQEMVDIVRIDHFRAFESYWEIPAESKTAVNGRWVKGPGDDFFSAVRKRFPDIEILAEDLGMITSGVHALRDRNNLPGMNVFQFAFQLRPDGSFDSSNGFLPHNHAVRSVVYTGTHDNNTTRGWFQALSGPEKTSVRSYLGRGDNEITRELVRAAQMSVAEYAVIPMQDVLDLPAEARMNTPGTVGAHNWSWRVRSDALNDQVAGGLRELSELYGRVEHPEGS